MTTAEIHPLIPLPTLPYLPDHVPRRGEDLGVVQKAAGGEVAIVPLELLADPHVPLLGPQAVDGADVVQPSTGHIAARGSVRTGHHPAGAQGDGVDLRVKGERSKVNIHKCAVRASPFF